MAGTLCFLHAHDRAFTPHNGRIAVLRSICSPVSWQGVVQEKRKQLRSEGTSLIAANQVLPARHTMRLRQADGVHELVIEATAPIFCVAVTSSMPATFLESSGSAAILTVCQVQPDATHASLATYRCARAVLSCPTPVLYHPDILRLDWHVLQVNRTL